MRFARSPKTVMFVICSSQDQLPGRPYHAQNALEAILFMYKDAHGPRAKLVMYADNLTPNEEQLATVLNKRFFSCPTWTSCGRPFAVNEGEKTYIFCSYIDYEGASLRDTVVSRPRHPIITKGSDELVDPTLIEWDVPMTYRFPSVVDNE